MKENSMSEAMNEKTGAAAPETGVKAADAGQEDMPGTEKQEKSKPGWDELMADPEYKSCFDSRVQEIVRKRLRDRHGSEETLGRLRPVLEALGEKYGLESTAPEAIDAQALSELIRTPPGFGSGEEIRQHLEELAYQAAALRESFPEFSLEREMEDPEFLRLTAPHTGLTLADAYYALHREEIGAMAARRSLEALTRAVSYGGARPREIAGNMAASSMTADPRSMSRDEREALKKRIYEAKAQGRKLPYGS